MDIIPSRQPAYEAMPLTEPLTDEEQAHLLHIFRSRRNLLISVGLILGGMICYIVLPEMDLSGGKGWQKLKRLDYLVSQNVLMLSILGALLLLILGYCLMLYIKRIHPFLSDARGGKKEVVSCRIIRKQYFPYTGQYFISFSDPRYMHHEVDAVFYEHCREGDIAYLYRAPRSKYVFDERGRFTLM